MTLILLALWALIGLWGFAYWWDSDYGPGAHRDPSVVPLWVISGCVLGPLAWIVGYFIHGGER